MDILNWLEVEPNVYSAGQPEADRWDDIAMGGVTKVVNLRPLAEQQEDERLLVETAGMGYVHLPVSTLNDIDAAMISQFDKLLGEHSSGLLVHCASGNRVGALFALAAKARGASVEEAMLRGREAGLTKLAPQVEMLLR